MQNHKAALLRQMQDEREALKAMNTVEMITAFSAYAEAVKLRVADIDDAMRKLETRIEVAREDMREAFAEFKKIEITQDRREEAELAALEKKQAELLDEVALEGFRRRMEEE